MCDMRGATRYHYSSVHGSTNINGIQFNGHWTKFKLEQEKWRYSLGFSEILTYKSLANAMSELSKYERKEIQTLVAKKEYTVLELENNPVFNDIFMVRTIREFEETGNKFELHKDHSSINNSTTKLSDDEINEDESIEDETEKEDDEEGEEKYSDTSNINVEESDIDKKQDDGDQNKKKRRRGDSKQGNSPKKIKPDF